MKKIIITLSVCICLQSVPGYAETVARTAKGLSEAEQLGITAGLALACNAGSKLDDFELIASRIIANQAPTEKAEQDGYRSFAQYKLYTFREQKENPQLTCGQVLDDFNQLPIFKSIVYADGSVKMPDGKMLRPKRPVKSARAKTSTKNQAKTAPVSRTTVNGTKKIVPAQS